MDGTSLNPTTPLFLNNPLPSTGLLVEKFQGWNKIIPENYFPFPPEEAKRKREPDDEGERSYKRVRLGIDELPTEEKAMAQFTWQLSRKDEKWENLFGKLDGETESQPIPENLTITGTKDRILHFCSQLPPLNPYHFSRALLLLAELIEKYNKALGSLRESIPPRFDCFESTKDSQVYEKALLRILQTMAQHTLDLQDFHALLICLTLINWDDEERRTSMWEPAACQNQRTAIHRTLAHERVEILKHVKEHIQRFGKDRKQLEKFPEINFTLHNLARLAIVANLTYSDINVAVVRLLRNCVIYSNELLFSIALNELLDLVPSKLTVDLRKLFPDLSADEYAQFQTSLFDTTAFHRYLTVIKHFPMNELIIWFSRKGINSSIQFNEYFSNLLVEIASKISNRCQFITFILNQIKGIIQNKAPFGKLSEEAERAIVKIMAYSLKNHKILPVLQLLQAACEHNLFFFLPENLIEDICCFDECIWYYTFLIRKHPQISPLIKSSDVIKMIANELIGNYNKFEFWQAILSLLEEGYIKENKSKKFKKLNNALLLLNSNTLKTMDAKTALMAHRAIVTMKQVGLFVHEALAPEINEKEMAAIDQLLAELKKKCTRLDHRRRQLDGTK